MIRAVRPRLPIRTQSAAASGPLARKERFP